VSNPIRKAAFAVLALAAAAIGGVSWGEPAGHAAALSPASGQAGGAFARPDYQGSVYGDFTMAGNSVLRCPAAGQAFPGEYAACAAASQREQVDGRYYDNEDFYLERSELTGQPAFDAGQAQLSIPAGATVRYAQLNWGGNTGQASLLGLSHLLTTCGDGLLGLLPAQPPPSPAAASPQRQDVQLGFASGAGSQLAQIGQPVTVPPAHFGVTSENVFGVSTGMYSAYANVTTSVAQAAAAAATLPGQAAAPVTLTATVGNVWAMSGHSCTAGWSLIVVFGYRSRPASPASPYRGLRAVRIYSGQHMQQAGATTSLTVSGPNDDVNTAGAELGVTAFDGDINASGEFLAGGQPQNDPCSADTSGSANFFSACAQGALDPLDPGSPILNNFSVDAKVIRPGVASAASPPGSSALISMTGTVHPYLLQSVALSESIAPALQVSIAGPGHPLHAGQQAGVAVTVRNTGDVPLYHVAVPPSPVATPPACPDPQVGTLAPGESKILDCTVTAEQASFPATVTVAGQYQRGDPQLTVSGSAATTIDVVTPVVAVGLTDSPSVVRGGQPATLTFTVTNKSATAEGPLDVTVGTSPALPGCHPAPVRGLRPGAQATTTCSATPAQDVTVTATATAVDGYDATGQATSAPLDIGVMNPALDLTVVPQPGKTQAGQAVDFTVTVHNTGDVPLAVTVTNNVAPACDFTTPTQGLAIGAAQSQKCTVKAPATAGEFGDTAQFTAKPVGHTTTGVTITGAEAAAAGISGQATGTAGVLAAGVRPALDMTVVSQPDRVRPRQPVNFTVTVHNTGDVPLAVTVTNNVAPACDFTTPTQGLAIGAAQSQKCTVKAPVTAGAFGDAAQFTAKPVGHTSTGVPVSTTGAEAITGQAAAAADVLGAGRASTGGTPSPHGSPGTGTPPGSPAPASSGGSVIGPAGGGSAVSSGGAGTSSGGLSGAGTGVAVGIPILLGAAAVTYVATSRRSGPRRG
jgi:hypothetical protein